MGVSFSLLFAFGKRLSTCRKHYEEFIRAGRGERYREDFHCGETNKRILGDDRFIEKMMGKDVAQTCK